MLTVLLLLLLAVAVGVLWWIRQRSEELRRQAEAREAQMLETLFTARRSAAGNGGETLDLEKVFGGETASNATTSADAVLRAAGLQADLIALVKAPPAAAAVPVPAPMPEAVSAMTKAAGPATRPISAAKAPVAPSKPSPKPSAPPAVEQPVQVRDLVQIFYEARGYRAVPAARGARPIELVLRHKTDPLRSYAFAPIAEPVSEETARAMLELARRIDQSRVLIATERGIAASLVDSLAAQGIRVLDGATIEAQLERLDFATSAKIRAVARRRAARRAQGEPG